MIGRREHDQVFTAIVLIDADNIEQVHGKGDQVGIVILLFNAFGQLLRLFAAVGVNLQQAIATLFQLRFQRIVLLTAGFDQLIEAFGGFRGGKIINQFVMHAVIHGATGRAGMFKRIKPFVVPANQHGLRGSFQIRNVDLDIVRLTDTVETANTLLQQIRVERQIEHYQVAGKLEVTAFGANFRTQQHLGAGVFFGEPCGGTVALNDGHTFMEDRGADPFALAQNLLQLKGGGRFCTDHQHFLRTVAGEIAHQPLDARVEVPPCTGIAFKFLINLFRVEHIARALFCGFTRTHNAGDFNRRLILGGQRQTNGVQLAFREAFNAVTGITEQHAAGAVAIHQH